MASLIVPSCGYPFEMLCRADLVKRAMEYAEKVTIPAAFLVDA